jgi:GNAT superfamily N-acetyltransferase
MSDARQFAQRFLDALQANDTSCYEAILCDDVGLLIGGWDGSELYRPRERVIRRLMKEWSAWPNATLEALNIITEDDQAAIQYRIQATENDRYIEHDRSGFLRIKDGKIHRIDLYYPEPMPSARRKGWIAPATLTDEEVERLFDTLHHASDFHEWMPPRASGRQSLRGFMGGSGDAHPGSNVVAGVRWTEAEADRRIDETIDNHRRRNIGFQWFVGPFDTPGDLRGRLERHGLILAGDAAVMARLGLDRPDIPINSSVEIELIDGTRATAFDELAHILMVCFNWTQQQVDEHRPALIESATDPKLREREASFLAHVNGQPAAYGRVRFQAGVAFLNGAGTLPDFRNRKIYSTLLRHRLEYAHMRGYNVAAIYAEPMSRRIVTRYGFKEYARQYLYAWMPVIDMNVIRSLVPQD